MRYTIKDLTEGKCIVINDGTVEELQQVIALAFPECNVFPQGTAKYYYKGSVLYWNGVPNINKSIEHLPIQSVKGFLIEDKWEPINGEEVEFKSRMYPHWLIANYVGKIDWLKDGNDSHAVIYKNGMIYRCAEVRKPIKKVVVTLQQIADKFNTTVDRLTVIE